MQILRVATVFLLMRGCLAATSLSPDQINTILQAHNFYRKNVSPTAANMEYMEWDDDLATIAQGWADNCDFAHNPNRGDTYTGSVGENIYASTGSYTAGSETTNWHNEVADYTYSSNSCASGKVCGHYTQVVWAASTKLGCGHTVCSTLGSVGWNNANLVVCNYAPAGNYGGQKPYISGTPCTQCANGNSDCSDNLCGNPGAGGVVTTATPEGTPPATTAGSNEGLSCPSGFDDHWGFGHCLYVYKKPLRYQAAKTFCQNKGGKLFLLDNAADVNRLKAIMTTVRAQRGRKRGVWIGLTDSATEGTFVWDSGAALGAFTDWAPGSPADNTQARDCVQMKVKYNWQWVVSSCSSRNAFICEGL